MKQPPAVWPPFVGASLLLAMVAGFGVGGALFAALALGLPTGALWLALAQAHGHVQVVGWAGLMVVGVSLHFFPRLRGAPLPHPGAAPVALGLLAGGLLLRVVAAPLLAAAPPGASALVLRVALLLSGALELAGASVALALLLLALRHGPSAQLRAGLRSVLPLFLTTFGGIWLALAVNLLGVGAAALGGGSFVPPWADRLAVDLAYYAFLVPVCVAMSARTFPLYFRTAPPKWRLLQLGLALLLAGLALRTVGERAAIAPVAALGQLGLAAALGTFIFALGVFAPRRPLPRKRARPFDDPIELHAVSAYVWLVATAVLLVVAGLAGLGVVAFALPLDVERHALGAGFVTTLILGMAVHLLPGFAGRPVRSARLIWLTLFLANLAALLRLAPLLLGALLPAPVVKALLASTGLAGLLAVALLAVNLERLIPATKK